MVPSINCDTAATVLCCLLCCVERDRLVVRDFMRTDGDYFFSGVLDLYFSGSMLFCLSIYTSYTK